MENSRRTFAPEDLLEAVNLAEQLIKAYEHGLIDAAADRDNLTLLSALRIFGGTLDLKNDRTRGNNEGGDGDVSRGDMGDAATRICSVSGHQPSHDAKRAQGLPPND